MSVKSKVKTPSGVIALSTTRRQNKSLRLAQNPLSSSPSLITAPAAVSTSRRMAFNYSSSSVNGQSALSVSCTIPVCQIGNDAYNNGLLVQGQGTNSASTASLCDLNPYEFPSVTAATALSGVSGGSGSWVSPHLPLMALAFDRYAMRSLTFHYEPQAATTVADRLVFAATDDPEHPFLSAYGVEEAYVAFATPPPTQLSQLVTQSSVAFAPWKPWSLSVPVSKEPKYLYQDTGSPRFFNYASISCIGSAAPTTPAVYGILYATIGLSLYDPVPLVSAIGFPIAELHSRRFKRRLKKDEKKSQPDGEVVASTVTTTTICDPRTAVVSPYVMVPAPPSFGLPSGSSRNLAFRT